MRKIAPLFQLGHSSNSNTYTHPRSKHMEQSTKTSTSCISRSPSPSSAVMSPWRSYPHHPCSAHAATDAGCMSWHAKLYRHVDNREHSVMAKSERAWSDKCTARPTIGLIARECTEHDKERKSISIVKEPLSHVVRKLHGTRPRSRRWAQIW